MALVTWIAIILIILLIIIIGILVIPFQISMQLYRENNINQGYLRIKWIGIRIINRKLLGKSSKKEKKQKRRRKSRFDLNRIPKIISLIEESLPYIIRIFNTFLKSITVKRISIDSIFSLDSYTDTVMISGYLWSITPFVNLIPNTYFSVEPDFQIKGIEGSLILKLKLKLYPVATEFLRALTKKPFRSLLNEFRKVNR